MSELGCEKGRAARGGSLILPLPLGSCAGRRWLTKAPSVINHWCFGRFHRGPTGGKASQSQRGISFKCSPFLGQTTTVYLQVQWFVPQNGATCFAVKGFKRLKKLPQQYCCRPSLGSTRRDTDRASSLVSSLCALGARRST